MGDRRAELWRADPTAVRWALRGVVVLLVVAAASCLAIGADRPANPALLPNADRAPVAGHSSPTSRVAGFGQIGFRLVAARSVRKPGALRCALLADTAPALARGMSGQRSFAGYDAMLLRFPADTTTPVSPRGDPMALSVAWFDAAGVLVGQADLPACTRACQPVAPEMPYRLALEVGRGGLRRLGVSPGSVLLVGGNCGS